MVINSPSFCLSRKILISPSFLKEGLLNILFLAGSFFLHTLIKSSQSLLFYKVSAEKFTSNLKDAPLQMTNHFSLANFRILSLSVTFDSFFLFLQIVTKQIKSITTTANTVEESDRRQSVILFFSKFLLNSI